MLPSSAAAVLIGQVQRGRSGSRARSGSNAAAGSASAAAAAAAAAPAMSSFFVDFGDISDPYEDTSVGYGYHSVESLSSFSHAVFTSPVSGGGQAEQLLMDIQDDDGWAASTAAVQSHALVL